MIAGMPSGLSGARPWWRGAGGGGKLLPQDARGDFLDAAAFEGAELEGTVGDADEAGDGKAEVLHDAADFAIAALAEADGQPGIVALPGIDGSLDRAVADAIDGDSLGERFQRA